MTKNKESKVWILQIAYSSGISIVGVYDSEEKAKEAKIKENDDELYIEEYDVE